MFIYIFVQFQQRASCDRVISKKNSKPNTTLFFDQSIMRVARSACMADTIFTRAAINSCKKHSFIYLFIYKEGERVCGEDPGSDR